MFKVAESRFNHVVTLPSSATGVGVVSSTPVSGPSESGSGVGVGVSVNEDCMAIGKRASQ